MEFVGVFNEFLVCIVCDVTFVSLVKLLASGISRPLEIWLKAINKNK